MHVGSSWRNRVTLGAFPIPGLEGTIPFEGAELRAIFSFYVRRVDVSWFSVNLRVLADGYAHAG